MSEINDCPICLVPIIENDKRIVTVSCCGKKFHTGCYLECMATKLECPMCRQKFSTEPIKITVSPNIPDNTNQGCYNNWCEFNAKICSVVIVLGLFTGFAYFMFKR